MPGWNLKYGILKNEYISEDKLWSLFNYVFSDGCHKRNTYKFGIIKAILDNMFNCINIGGRMYLSYNEIFSKFAENYWNLVTKYNLKQMRKDGKSEYSILEKIFYESLSKNPQIEFLEFESIPLSIRTELIQKITKLCKKYVLGALYQDMEGCLYEFDLRENGIFLSYDGYSFMLKYKIEIEKLNYYAWAKFLESVNNDNVLLDFLIN